MPLDPSGDYAAAALELLIAGLQAEHGKDFDEDVARQNLPLILDNVELMIREMLGEMDGLIPDGGTTGQSLTKVSDTDYDVQWDLVSEFSDSLFRVQDNADGTKELAFELSGLTTATTRTLTVPDLSGTILATTDTFSSNQLIKSNGSDDIVQAQLFVSGAGHLRPENNNSQTLGTVSFKWSTLYVTNIQVTGNFNGQINYSGGGNILPVGSSSQNLGRLTSGGFTWQNLYLTGDVLDGTGAKVYQEVSANLDAEKTSDETVNNSTSLQDDDELVVSVEASAYYRLDAYILYSASSTADLKAAFSVPTGATIYWHDSTNTTPETTGSLLLAGSGVGTVRLAVIHGILYTSATAGDVTFRWAQNTLEASDAVVHRGSALSLRRVSA